MSCIFHPSKITDKQKPSEASVSHKLLENITGCLFTHCLQMSKLIASLWALTYRQWQARNGRGVAVWFVRFKYVFSIKPFLNEPCTWNPFPKNWLPSNKPSVRSAPVCLEHRNKRFKLILQLVVSWIRWNLTDWVKPKCIKSELGSFDCGLCLFDPKLLSLEEL